jgi:RHS repeat-associated protein
METDNAGVVQAVYTYGNDLISMNRAGTVSYYHYDGLGSTRQMTDSSEAVVASYTYDSFGSLIASSGTVVNAYGFTGEQQLNEADNLVFLRARYYDSRVGRFISRDPIGYEGGLNLYTYCGNNPVMFVDPLGTVSHVGCAPFAGWVVGMVIFCDEYCSPVPALPGCDPPPDPDPKCREKCMSDLIKFKKPPWISASIGFWVTAAICSFL